MNMSITLKSPEEIEKMRVAGRLASEVLDYITPFIKPGVTTGALDKLCHDYMVDGQDCIPAPLDLAPAGINPAAAEKRSRADDRSVESTSSEVPR